MDIRSFRFTGEERLASDYLSESRPPWPTGCTPPFLDRIVPRRLKGATASGLAIQPLCLAPEQPLVPALSVGRKARLCPATPQCASRRTPSASGPIPTQTRAPAAPRPC